jgi:uncharacterized protein YbjT (DUF2867 family)
MTAPVLVTGATGTQGGAVARALLARGRPVRVLTRDPAKPAARELAELGAEVVAGDFDDPGSLRRAATGTSAVFAMGTFEISPEVETRQAIALIDAAAEAGTGHVLYTSVAGALDGTGIPHFESKAEVERHLAGLDLASTVIAPAAFLENVTAPWSAPLLAQGQYAFALPAELPLQQVAIADLAEFAVLVLTNPGRFTGQRIELASVEHTGTEVAAVLGRALGREVSYVETPADESDDDTYKMVQWFRAGGYTVDIPGLRTAYPEVGWHDLDKWVAEQNW